MVRRNSASPRRGDGAGSRLTGEAEAFRIFISYTHVDEPFRETLEKHLSPLLLLGRAEVWHDRHIQAGGRLYEKIQTNIESAHIILMLISADYLASKACQAEMSTALAKADEGSAVAIPVIIRACDWMVLPIGSLLAAPEDGAPINSEPDPDVAWTEVARAIGRIINERLIQQPLQDVGGGARPPDAAAAEEQSLKPASRDAAAERWVNRRDDNDHAWDEALRELVDALLVAAERDEEADVSLNVRGWGEKIIVDFTLPQHRNSRRLLIRDIGGYVGYPGYQLEVYAADDRLPIDYKRMRWLDAGDGSRVLRQTMPAAGDSTIGEFAADIWRTIIGLARSPT